MANKLNITKGNYISSNATESTFSGVSLIEDHVLSVQGTHCYENLDAETSDIATLCADALNTYQACNILPSELLQQRNDLLHALKNANKVICQLKLSMLTHPDCEPGSEFDDYTDTAQAIENVNEKLIQKITQ